LQGTDRGADERLGDVFAPNGEVFGGLDAHLDVPARAPEQRDLDRTVREQLGQCHVGIRAICGLDDDGFIGAASND
jgi:hypothetical protein